MASYDMTRMMLEQRIIAAEAADKDYWLDELIRLMAKHDKESSDA